MPKQILLNLIVVLCCVETGILYANTPATTSASLHESESEISARIQRFSKDWFGACKPFEKDRGVTGWENRDKVMQARIKSGGDQTRNDLVFYLSLPKAWNEGNSTFSVYARAALIAELVTTGDRNLLVMLLSGTCPNSLYNQEIEWFLVDDTDNKISDPLVVLCEAYDRSDNKKNRDEIAAALRRAVGPEVPHDVPDAAYVRRVSDWYRANKANLKVNEDYELNKSRRGVDSAELAPLFIIQKSVKASESKIGK